MLRDLFISSGVTLTMTLADCVTLCLALKELAVQEFCTEIVQPVSALV